MNVYILKIHVYVQILLDVILNLSNSLISLRYSVILMESTSRKSV